MRIPKYLHIRRSKWKVKLGSKRLDTEKYKGVTYFDTHEILLDPGLPRNDLEETFYHELLHAVWPAGAVSDKKEEEIVNQLAKTLYESLEKSGLVLVKSRRKIPQGKKKIRKR